MRPPGRSSATGVFRPPKRDRSRRNGRAAGAALLGLGVLLLNLCAGCAAPGDRAVTVFGGQYANEELFSKILLFKGLDLQDSYMVAGAYSQKIGQWPRQVRWELEGQVVKHFEGQDNWEVNGLIVARWEAFPWSETVPTTFAIGEGFSYALSVPELEDEILAPEGGTSQYLNYLMLELTMGLLPWEGWSVVTRIHHRSGIFGLIGDVEEGSNFMTIGLRYQF